MSLFDVTKNDIYLKHYGMPRRSGRYPYGSGEDPYQHTQDFLSRYDSYKKAGYSEVDIAKAMGVVDDKGKPSTGKLRTQYKIATNDRRMLRVMTAERLRDKEGLGPTEIGRKMGISESTVRTLLDTKRAERTMLARNTAEFLKEQIKTKGMIDVGVGVERELGISKEALNAALTILEMEGYPTYGGRVPQPTNPGKQTTIKVVCPPGTQHKDIYNYDNIHQINEYASHDGGQTFDKFVYPKSMDSKRLMIRYADDIGPDGVKGIDKDGIVEIRRGVKDLSLGDSHYAQVRILVDGNKYIKGMAVYSDDMPDGVDVVFNSNKTKGMDALKDIKKDPENPFGSLIKANGQSYYIDDNGKKQLSLINKRADEGDWTDWKDTLPSQFLAKQSYTMVKKQLNLAKADKLAEFEDICALDNPTIKKYYLEKFADECDSAAVHLKAAALPGQKYHVIVPINSLKDNEVYAPQYESGTKLALVRYPHGGTFEIPILTVNNKNPLGQKIIGNASIDAVGITKANADRLSGADFDGDTVMCIPTHDPLGKVKVISKPPLKDLEGFDPKVSYGADDVKVDSSGVSHYYRNGKEYALMTKKGTQTQMGIVSNLITDMTLAGAKDDELARAVRHSMVVIDAEKHHLDYKSSEIANNIDGLKKKYQVKIDADGNVTYGGASTLLSRSKGEVSVLKRQGSPGIDPETGKKTYKLADDLYYPERSYDKKTGIMTIKTADGKKISYKMSDKDAVDKYSPVKKTDDNGQVYFTNKSGDIVYKRGTRTQSSTRMAETDDAYSLLSPLHNTKEIAYADYANSMKSLANRARLEMIRTKETDYDPSAAKVYSNEVASLKAKLNTALLNAPRERAATLKANAEIKDKKEAYEKEHDGEKMPTSEVKKISQQALTKYRSNVGSVPRRDRSIKITDREWEAIQAGAISKSQLKKILNNSDADSLRQRAMPRSSTNVSQAKINKMKSMSASNFTLEQIAKACGCSTSTVAKYLKGV